MRKIFFILFVLVTIFLTSSCQKELPDSIKNVEVSQGGQTPTPTPTPTAELKVSEPGQFGAKGGEQTITVTASAAWAVNKSAGSEWLTITPESGKAGNITVTLSATENASTEQRTATITVWSEDITKKVEVTQAGANREISIDTNNLEFTADEGTKSFKITTNTSWTVSSDQTWCSVSPASGKNDGTVTVKVTENTTISGRTAMITVKSDVGDQTIKVTQSGVDAKLTLNVNSMEFAAGSGSKMFMISANTAWAISSNKNWCSISPTSGSGDGSVTVSVDENTSTSSRTATITVESASITRTLAVTQSGAEPPASQDRTFTVGGVTFKMIYVEGGAFTMGATSEQGDDAYDEEKPAHAVTLSSYSIGETEVTQALWQAVMGSNPSGFSGSNRPVECVSWNDCQEFIKKLNAITGENFRLPTEAEWEYAARGGNKSRGYKYAGSNTLSNVAWYWDNIPSQSSGSAGYGTQNVATKQANELGIYDMSGNVYEWCNDWYGSYSSGSQTNPTGPASGISRVFRGGGWNIIAGSCRVSFRSIGGPTRRYSSLGFRLAL